jgi:hypothetical protein
MSKAYIGEKTASSTSGAETIEYLYGEYQN